MQLLKRIGYYLVGVSLGSIIVMFVWKGKDVSFDYGPDARTLKTIRIKQRIFSSEALNSLATHQLDTAVVSTILLTGDVNFGKSNQRKKPCAEYFIEGSYEDHKIELWTVRCDSTATIEKIWIR